MKLKTEMRLVAIKAPHESEADYLVERLTNEGFEADSFEHGGEWYARITNLHGSDPEDATCELSWYFGSAVGSIPDTREAIS